MGRASLNNQFFNVLNKCTELGRDKHSDKASGVNSEHLVIYSRKDREALSDTTKQLSTYTKENYAGVKLIKDITPNMIQNFLDSKVNTTQFSGTWSWEE